MSMNAQKTRDTSCWWPYEGAQNVAVQNFGVEPFDASSRELGGTFEY